MTALTNKPLTPSEMANVKSAPHVRKGESWRETIESVIFALILAFLFRTFEAEAFVIPTGSMAPTLYGRHKESLCEKCGQKIVIGASDEVYNESGYLKPNSRIKRAVCPNCRYENKNLKDALAFNGDRILVNKYPYEFGEPQRWDVFVFKFPEEPETNYIKRLVGLPNEILRIRRGDVNPHDSTTGDRILRKDPAKQRVLQLLVYDNDLPAAQLTDSGWPERWASVAPADNDDDDAIGGWTASAAGWTLDAARRSFSISSDAELRWLRYRHLVPTLDDWRHIDKGIPLRPSVELVSDFCGYNAYTGTGEVPITMDMGTFWVGDLTLNFTLKLDSIDEGGELVLELCEGKQWFRCRIDPHSGQATLLKVNVETPDREQEMAHATTSIVGPGEYKVSFANVDDRLCLWIDDTLVDFGSGAEYQMFPTSDALPRNTDLAPAGIAARGIQADVSHLLLQRDVYYRADRNSMANLEDGHAFPAVTSMSMQEFERRLAAELQSPEAWAETYREAGDTLDQMEFHIGPDQFVALGDNSPRSRDSRLWTTGMQTVPRNFLVGKAFFIYWPHGVPFLNNGRGYAITYHKQPTDHGLETVEDYPRYTVPFYPQVSRMRRIR